MNDLAQLDNLLPTTWSIPTRGPNVPASPLPEDAGGINLRLATEADLPFVDRLHKANSKSLGFLPTKALEGKLRLGEVTIAEDAGGTRVGYVIASDRYMKREDVGVFYQVAVADEHRRSLVGAAMVRGVIERWPYGVRLACCWCAQDLVGPMRFWESLGFVPIAYRGGSASKGKIHVFWQRRTRPNDAVDWWYPSQTTGGQMASDRLVLPIPPGMHWSEAKAVFLPGSDEAVVPTKTKRRKPAKKNPTLPPEPTGLSSGGFRFSSPAPVEVVEETLPVVKEKVERPKNDPKLVKKVRELRDHYLEHINAGDFALPDYGKYDVARVLPDAKSHETEFAPLRIEARVVRALPEAA